ncbi:MAG: ECF transporter S component [Clostridia bacterium]|nr:ECF transporter S component [Clostridia bacterium]
MSINIENNGGGVSPRKKINIRYMATVGLLSALSTVLMYIEFSVPFMPAFIKCDVSDLPALIASFSLGPIAGVLTQLLKNLLHLPVTTTSGVGELANFILGAAFVLPAGIIYRYVKNKKGALIGSLVGMLAMAAASFPVNLFITYPFYTNFMPLEAIIGAYSAINPAVDSLPEALLMFNVPFTAAKGLISVIITFLVYKRISPLLRGKPKSLK